jgi:nucleoside-diphosphate-sugar epimerase
MKKICAITGSRGYLGSRVAIKMEQCGWEIRSLTRKPISNNQNWRQYSLDTSPNILDLEGVDTLIHCAYDFGSTQENEIRKINLDGSKALFNIAAQAKVKNIIFISTIAAFKESKSIYGKIKYEIEQSLPKVNSVVIRPALIYGDNPDGMIGALIKAVSSLPIIPLIGNGSWEMYLTHEDDLCNLISEAATNPGAFANGGYPVIAAYQQPLQFKEILQTLAKRNNKQCYYIPIPWKMMWALLWMCEKIGVKAPFRSDSIISMVHPNSKLTFNPDLVASDYFRPF